MGSTFPCLFSSEILPKNKIPNILLTSESLGSKCLLCLVLPCSWEQKVVCWTMILLAYAWPNQADRNLMYQDAEVLSDWKSASWVKWEVPVLQFCNLEMEGLEWLWEYIKSINPDMPISIASSWATDFKQHFYIKEIFKNKWKRLFSSALKKYCKLLGFITEPKNWFPNRIDI